MGNSCTHTGRYLWFDSARPIGQKRSVAAALFSRASRICSEPGLRKQELAVVRNALCKNGYPSQLLRTQQLRSSVAYPEVVCEEARQKRAAVPYAKVVRPPAKEALGKCHHDRQRVLAAGRKKMTPAAFPEAEATPDAVPLEAAVPTGPHGSASPCAAEQITRATPVAEREKPSLAVAVEDCWVELHYHWKSSSYVLPVLFNALPMEVKLSQRKWKLLELRKTSVLRQVVCLRDGRGACSPPTTHFSAVVRQEWTKTPHRSCKPIAPQLPFKCRSLLGAAQVERYDDTSPGAKHFTGPVSGDESAGDALTIERLTYTLCEVVSAWSGF
ncbi:hypothetical protein HPB50_015439 [Hyalomma asiaticum]|uniref:Uncharacterized protein n=1 Tax=Hyalomma asiaticum TaxID=266040 RepID=A0ACB7TPR4_HYAAI|nr:hypothetical protein HPB50_015439 [Hyalomma asiaticum]